MILLGCPGSDLADPEGGSGSSSTTQSAGSSGAPADGSTGVAEGGGATEAGSGTTEGPGPTTGEPPAACEIASVFEPGVHTDITIDVDGVMRRYDLFVPNSYDPTASAPLVLNFHGLFGTPSQQADFSQFDATAEGHGMLVAYPEGIGQSFNAGVCCGTASSTGVDDVGFARALVADVSAKMCVDPRRVYATGMSNGGHMAHRLACEAADLFAATASVAGVLSLAGPCVPSRPISMVQLHGTADGIVAYNGFPAVPAMMEAWAARNGCSAQSEVIFDQGDTHCETWPGCDAGVEVTLCTIEGGGHCWPGNPSCLFGASTTEIHASDEIAEMFDMQLLP
ncbi:MAG: prolyl oligopeptidase family serine peptidase [Myxococcales bacterium]|nr:prolyl oligopeptidase family serine peptidase [Myxococcales bacterium]MCB9714780.1 prolyl oligopeptidase family serine peptidase [Myxococcales bacterium]